MNIATALQDYCCKWISLKFGAIFLAVWGLVAGILQFERSLVLSIEMIDTIPEESIYTLHNVYGALHLFSLQYDLCLPMIISFYLLCATLAEFSSKTSFVATWVIYGIVADTYTLIDLIISCIKSYKYYKRHFVPSFSILCCQFGFLAIVFCYYKSLPKKKITWS